MPRLMGSRSLGGDLWWGRGVDGEGEGEEGRVGHLRRDFRIMSRAPWLDTSEEGRRRNRGMAGDRSDRRGGGFESRTDSSPLLFYIFCLVPKCALSSTGYPLSRFLRASVRVSVAFHQRGLGRACERYLMFTMRRRVYDSWPFIFGGEAWRKSRMGGKASKQHTIN